MWGGVAIFVTFAPSWCFLREAEYIAANRSMTIKQAKKVSGIMIQIISPNVLQEITTILQLKVCIVYVVWKLVGQPP